jgi:Asp-tRNA(Asn)/Glu-tRNA(Gln) amidotransferase C subunit
MDPLSLTASIIGVITAAKAGVKALLKLNEYRKAPQEVEDLASELESVQGLLDDVGSFFGLNVQFSYCGSLLQCVGRADKETSVINTLLASTPFKLPRLSDAGQARVVFFRQRQAEKSAG